MSVGGELHRLLESGDYLACLAQGRALLAAQESLPAPERARVLSVLSRCQLALGDLRGTVASATEAALTAREQRLPDLEGAALLDLATALIELRRHEEALAALDRFRQGLPAYTASQCLEGAALQRTALVMDRTGKPAEAADWYQRALHWFRRFGDEESAGDCLLGSLEAHLAAANREEAGRCLAEVERHARAHLDHTAFTGQLALARARYLRLAGQPQASVDEAFRALVLAEPLSPLQVEAQLHLSRMAEAMDRPVDALNFAFAARVSAIDARLYPLEFAASALLMRLLRRHGAEPLAELSAEMERQGVDLYQYLDAAEAERLVRNE